MASRNTDMQAIFSELSEMNKDIVILIAKSVKVAQEVAEQPRNPPPQCRWFSHRSRSLFGRSVEGGEKIG